MNDPPIQLGICQIHEAKLLNQLETLKRAIEGWAVRNDLWQDAGFHIPFIHNRECPRKWDVLYLWFEGPLFQLFDSGGSRRSERRYLKEFDRILNDHGFDFDLKDKTTAIIFPSEDSVAEEYFALYRWQWLQLQAEKRLTDIHFEIFEHIAKYPDHLRRLSWRQYEELLDSIFKNQGFRTELGPGSNDGGVDIRLYQNLGTPELVTLVQAKRYNKRPIGLDAVAGLLGVAVEQQAAQGILVTTSRFQPKAQKFARTIQQRVDLPSIDLVDSRRVAGWCEDISKLLVEYFSGNSICGPPPILPITLTALTGKVVVASGGYGIITNIFGVLESDFPNEVVIRLIGSLQVDGDGQCGHEIPVVNEPGTGKRFVAAKSTAMDGTHHFWGDRHLFSVWDGAPRWFDHCD